MSGVVTVETLKREAMRQKLFHLYVKAAMLRVKIDRLEDEWSAAIAEIDAIEQALA